MKRIIAIALVLAAGAAGSTIVNAQEQPAEAPQTRVYIIQAGDTLWDLSSSQLNSPWYWPRIWHINPTITNPHRIYPGQRLNMPAAGGTFAAAEAAPTQPDAVTAVAEAPAPATETAPVVAEEPAAAPVTEAVVQAPAPEPAPVEEEPAPVMEAPQDMLGVEEQLPALPDDSRLQTAILDMPQAQRYYVRVGSESFVSREKLKAAATVVGSHLEKMLYTEHDLVFISLGENSGVEVGQRFTAYRPEQEVMHPVSNRMVGYRTKQLGVLQVVSVQEDVATAKIIEAYDAIAKETFLVPFQPFEKRIVPQPTEGELDAVVVMGTEGLSILGEHQVVYIDKGADDNLAIGNIVEFYRPMPKERDVLTNKMLRIPDKIVGAGIVVDTQPKTASLLIWDSKDVTYVGDRVRALR